MHIYNHESEITQFQFHESNEIGKLKNLLSEYP